MYLEVSGPNWLGQRRGEGLWPSLGFATDVRSRILSAGASLIALPDLSVSFPCLATKTQEMEMVTQPFELSLGERETAQNPSEGTSQSVVGEALCLRGLRGPRQEPQTRTPGAPSSTGGKWERRGCAAGRGHPRVALYFSDAESHQWTDRKWRISTQQRQDLWDRFGSCSGSF